MGVVFVGFCLSCLFFNIRHTPLVISAVTTDDNTTPLAHTDSNTTWMEIKQTAYFLIGECLLPVHEICKVCSCPDWCCLEIYLYTFNQLELYNVSHQQKAQLFQQLPSTEQWHSTAAELGAI